MNFANTSLFLGVFLTLMTYGIGIWVKSKISFALFNPILISVVIIIAVLFGTGMKYDTYYQSAQYLSYLLTPATICLAIPLYEQLELLKNNWKAILIGTFAGVLSSMGSVLAMAYLFGFSHAEYVTFLPKSITTAIGMGLSEELGGNVSLTIASIMITGILGNMIAEKVCSLFRIKEPIAKGIAIGSASHAIGTAKAMEIGPIEGALSSLSIVVSGIITVVTASLFASLL